MRRFIFYIFATFLLSQANVISCNFKIAKYGSTKEQIKIEPLPPVVMPDRFGGKADYSNGRSL